MVGILRFGMAAALFGYAIATSAAGVEREIPCRNLKSAAQCALEEQDAQVLRDHEREAARPKGDARAAEGATAMPKITVTAERELSVAAPPETKWDRLARHLNANPVFVEMPANDGGRIACVTEPPVCKINCCVRSRSFALVNPPGSRTGGL